MAISPMTALRWGQACRSAVAALGLALLCAAAHASADICPRPAVGAVVEEPPQLRSEHGRLRVDLSLQRERLADGSERYCYVTADGAQSPTLRVHPGDEVIVRLRNALAPAGAKAEVGAGDACTRRPMTLLSTNLHFHGLTLPARCHEDDVLQTLVEPGDPPFEYRFRVPQDEAPGLYWYHAHPHGLTALQVGGGASGAIVVENGDTAGPPWQHLAQRILVVRDQPVLFPNAPQSAMDIALGRRDRDGDAGNSGTGYGMPARDLSVNFVPVPFPDYRPARLVLRPRERQLWRVVNASSVTYLNLALMSGGVAQPLDVVAIDGVALGRGQPGAAPSRRTDHLGLAPGARMEFVVQGPEAGAGAQLVTHVVNTGPDGENDPNRTLVDVVAQGEAAPAETATPTRAPAALPAGALPWIGDVAPARTRHFYFWETPFDPAHPDRRPEFYLTEEGHPMRVFDPAAGEPDVTVHQGEVEDWVIENRTREVHAFHVHQLHFQVREWFGMKVDEPFVRDTINVPFYDYRMERYPSVTLRMDFRRPTTVGTFVYHCHLLDHEDAGMMGTLRVEPAAALSEATDGLTRLWSRLGRWWRAAGPAEGPADASPAAAMCRPSARLAAADRRDAPLSRRAGPAASAQPAAWSPSVRSRLARAFGLGLLEEPGRDSVTP